MRTADSSSIAFCVFVIMIAAWKSCVDIGDIEDETRRIADAAEKVAKSTEMLKNLEINREKCNPKP